VCQELFNRPCLEANANTGISTVAILLLYLKEDNSTGLIGDVKISALSNKFTNTNRLLQI